MEYSFFESLADGPFLSFMSGFSTFATVNAPALGIPASAIVPLDAALTLYGEKLKKVTEDGNHGSGDVAAKDAAKRAAVLALEEFVHGNVRRNPLWTAANLIDAGFPAPKSGGGYKRIDESPLVRLSGKEHGFIKARGSCKSISGSGMAPFADFLQFVWGYKNTDGSFPQADEIGISHSVVSFSAAAEFEVPPAEKGREIAVYGRYLNHFPNPGPWSDPITIVIT